MPSWCARRRRSSPAEPGGASAELARDDGAGRRRRSISSAPRSIATASRRSSAIQSQQGINPRGVDEADVFAIHQAGGYTCVQVFFFRTGQNWGNRAYFPKADRVACGRRSARRLPRAILRRQAVPALRASSRTKIAGARAARRGAVRPRADTRSRSRVPQRGEKRTSSTTRSPMRARRSARKLAETSSQQALLEGAAPRPSACRAAAADRGLRQQPHPGHRTRSAR